MKNSTFVFTELRTRDAEKSRAFYADLVGWEYQDARFALWQEASERRGR